ncbi:MAG: phosphoribosylglycinamide synthetase C domain-containing protein, partial [Archangium sp.]
VVLAAHGYPEAPRTGDVLPALPSRDVFHAGTKTQGDALVTSGGRVLTVCAHAASLLEARRAATALAESIDWPGRHFRRDIGANAP